MTIDLTVVGLGPAGADLLPKLAHDALTAADQVFLRTGRHPAAEEIAGTRVCESFDSVYETAPDISTVYRKIVERLAAVDPGSTSVYAVPGSPFVAEHTVELLRTDGRFRLTVVPAMSFADLAWSRLGIDPFAVGARLVDGHRFAVDAAGSPGPLLVGQCDQAEVLSEIKLAVDDPPDSVVLLQHLGLADEHVTTVSWDALDHDVDPDHLTSLWIPHLAAPVAAELIRFQELVRTLRAGCPWDRDQTHASLTRHLVEEAHEVLDAIAALPDGAGRFGEPGPDDLAHPAYTHLCEELGDLLFQVYFHAALAAEAGQFTLADVARTVHDKLYARHPHVFGGGPDVSVQELSAAWERQKLEEKGRASVMDGIASSLPALSYAWKVQRKAESVGVDPESPPLAEPGATGFTELGELLWRAVATARAAGIDPEAALRARAQTLRDRVAGSGH